ncbi:hypothetical protein [Pseudoalteromonas piscicida]|uniref:hypothetical protein n=1 Tax=Pseudoalteromonas piscicida TaxID=43662 RepID=UPI0030B0803E
MAAFTAAQASVTNGQRIVTINSGESIAHISPGDFLYLSTFAPAEINKAYVGQAGHQYIELVKPWSYGDQNSQPVIVGPTTGDFRAAVDAITKSNTLVNDNYAAMQDWQTKLGTVTFKNQDGSESTIKTLKQLEKEAEEQLHATHPYPWAMRKVEFEARRAANNEKYAASGFVRFGKHHSSLERINDGMYSYPLLVNTLRLGRSASAAVGKSITDYPVVNLAGVVTELEYLSVGSPEYVAEVKLPPAEDGTRTYDSATGVSVTHATPTIAFASETATNKVVTGRVDMWGFEGFLREINDSDPFVYKNGLIQSRVTNIKGVETVDDNVRPDTYFAWYEGDKSSRGKGVNWQSATESQRQVIASDPNNNIYFDDTTGKFYQWCVRGRSFAGAGNGDWFGLGSVSDTALQFGKIDPAKSYPQPHGAIDDVASYTSGFNSGGHVYASNSTVWSDVTIEDVAIFKGLSSTSSSSDRATEGECYFLVCGTVSRLNKGAYHPSFNPLGSAYATDGIDLTDRTFWYTATAAIKSRTDAFVNVCQNPNATGSLSTTTSAGGKFPRPDGRFYDAIYASGQGGVCRDMRYSARGLTREDFAEADLAIKSGEYRGREYTTTSKVLDPSAAGSGNHPNKLRKVYPSFVGGENVAVLLLDTLEYPCTLRDVFHLYNKSLGVVFSGEVSNVGDNFIYILLGDKVVSDWTGDEVLLVQTKKLNTSVAGEYTHTDVIGDPAEILLCGDLEDGWVGDWVPEIPDGTVKDFKLNRPTTSTPTILETSDSGVNWSSVTTTTWSDLKNLYESEVIANSAIWLVSYSTKAKLTKETDNVKPYKDCLGVVSILGDHLDGRRSIVYSLTGDILNVRAWLASVERLPLLSVRYQYGTGELNPSGLGLTHTDVSDLLYKADTNYVKVFNYAVESNGLALINYAYRQLKFDTTANDFGDDAKVPLFDNANSSVDDNGNQILVGTAQIVEPLGWIKNDK